MTFRITVSQTTGISADFEVGSLAEAVGILTENETALTRLMSIQVGGAGGVTLTAGPEATAGEGNSKPRRGRPAKNQPDPSAAAAPPPAPVPAAAPVPPTPAPAPAAAGPTPAEQVAASAQNGLQVPPFLARPAPAPASVPPTPAAAPAAPPPPAPAPVPPMAAPVAGVLAPKVEAELRRRGTDAVSQKGLVDWLANPATGALVIANSTFDEACQCIKFMSDDKLRPVATALGVA